jgi:DNA polymerase elongation subunit (family B)
MVIDPKTYLETKNLKLHYHYYINKQIIPALERIFKLFNVGKILLL